MSAPKSAAAVELGQRGGRVRSDAKAAAARENGRKGGRPRRALTLREEIDRLGARWLRRRTVCPYCGAPFADAAQHVGDCGDLRDAAIDAIDRGK